MMTRVRRLVDQLLRREEGMQTMEWILLIALIGTILLGLMKWFQANESMVGQSIWELVKSWLDKAKPA